ncbi:MAG: dihydrolipoamide acetyltransferase family protein, partial [Bacteroidia bacterium]
METKLTMANKFELIMPKMGESIAEATILKWLKQPGDSVELDEAILEIATDKVDSEVPSPVDGVIEKVLFNEGDVVAVGKAVAIISTDAAVESAPAAQSTEGEKEAANLPVPETIKAATPATETAVTLDKPASGRFYSPLVMNIARTEGIAMNELEMVPGTGKEGRVTKKDILAYLKNRTAAPVISSAPAQSAPTAAAAPVQHQVDVPVYEGDEIVEMDRMRKLIADHMVTSKHVSPHVTSFVEADVTKIWNWRKKVKNQVQEKYGEKLTFTPIFIEAITQAIKEFPGVNVSVTNDLKIVKRKSINVGMAAALPSGNLIVPV